MSEEVAQKAQSAIGRSLVEKEEKAIFDALKISADEIYTAGEVAKQDKLLTKAGFKADEINNLRSKGVLGHSVISLSNGAPKGIVVQAIDLQLMNNQSLKALRNGKNLSYVVGENGSMYVTAEKLGAHIGKHLVIRDANFMTSMAVRTGMGLGMIEVQKQVHKQFVDEEGQHAAEDIAAFNRAHFFARLPVNHYFDQFMVKRLPNMIFNACQRKPKTAVLVSPRAIRLYERYGSTVLYYGLRNSIVGQ